MRTLLSGFLLSEKYTRFDEATAAERSDRGTSPSFERSDDL
ncbi:hypothetical protein [Aporhodopirellula aestuarii]|nr:hypothetical protein [Aporhodopirellula aestuarii]